MTNPVYLRITPILLLSASVALGACATGPAVTSSGGFTPADFDTANATHGVMYDAAFNGTATDLGTPTGSASYVGNMAIWALGTGKIVSALTLGIDFDNANAITGQLTNAISSTDRLYTGTIALSGTPTAIINNGGTSTISGGVFTGSFVDGSDSIVLDNMQLPNGTFRSAGGNDYIAGYRNGGTGTISFDGGAAVTPYITNFAVQGQ